MLTLTILRNPFNTTGREIVKIEFIPAKTIAQYSQPYTMGLDEFVYSANGKIVDADYIPEMHEFIAVCPVVGKNILSSILSVGLMLWTGGISNGLGLGTGMNAFWRGVTAMAIGMIGGSVISHLFPTPVADNSASETATSYGFGNLSAQTTQGGALPRTYGTMMTAGIELAKHVTTDGDKQYLNVLLTGGQGPIDSISDIQINGNPIANYNNVQVDIRLGSNDQAVIPNFGDTFYDQTLSYELTCIYADGGTSAPGPWSMQRVEGNAVQGLEVTIQLPNGLYHTRDDGRLEATTVVFEMQYRFSGDSNPWIPFGDRVFITESKNTAIRRSYRADGLPASSYEVRIRGFARVGDKADGNIDTRFCNRMYWTQVSAIIYDDFCRPGKILVGIKALGTDQLSGGDITVTWKQTVSNVWVWNPNTLQYQAMPATNQAWASYDILHGCRLLKNINTGQYEYVVDNIPARRIDYQAIADWASHCTVLGIEFNHLYDSATDLWTALKAPETFGRGKIVPKGTKFSAVCDKPSTPVQLFTVGNINQGKFSKDYAGLTDRANAIEISFINRDKGYQRDVITVYSDKYNADTTIKNPTQITLDGCTSYAQAYQFGMYLLRVNNLLIRTVSWEADIDAIACAMGDQVLLQHDVPQWGTGGRIISATTNSITLDITITMDPGKTYSTIVRLSDDSLITMGVINIPGDTNILQLSSNFVVIPNQYDLFTFGEVNKVAKPFIVVEVDRVNDLSAKLTGIEYVAAVYEESLDAPIIQYSPPIKLPSNIQNLSAEQVTWRTAEGTTLSQINISWVLPRGESADNFYIYTSKNKISWSLAKTTQSYSETIEADTGQTYYIKIVTQKNLMLSSGIISNAITTGRDSLPPDPLNLMVEQLPNGKKRFIWGYSYPTPNDVAGFRIKYNMGNSVWWQTAIPLHSGLIVSSPFEIILPASIATIMIKAVDNAGNESENTQDVIVNLGDEIVENVIWQKDFRVGSWSGVKTGCYVFNGDLIANDPGTVMYSDDENSPMYTVDDALMYQAQYREMHYEDTIIVDYDGQFMMDFEGDGNMQMYYRVTFPYPMYTNDADPMFTDDDLLMYKEGDWVLYTSKVQVQAGEIDIRVDIEAGTIQPAIRQLKVIIDVPDKKETLNDIYISAAGTRLPIVNKYRVITNVGNIAIQGGTTAIGVRVLDKNSISGPLIPLMQDSGTPTSGLVDVTIEGY